MTINYADTCLLATDKTSRIVNFLAGGTIDQGDWVCFDDSKEDTEVFDYVVTQATAAGHVEEFVGVAGAAGTSGSNVPVVVGGYVSGSTVTSATYAVGDSLMLTDAGDGVAYNTGSAFASPNAYSVEAVTGAALSIFVINKFDLR